MKEGDTVEEGEVVGLVGNNGKSRLPHVHLGAWVGSRPYQVRFGQKKMIGTLSKN